MSLNYKTNCILSSFSHDRELAECSLRHWKLTNRGDDVITHRYWNDPAVLSKLGRAMGVGVPGSEESGPGEAAHDEEEEEATEEDDEELTVHLTASTGDVEVQQPLPSISVSVNLRPFDLELITTFV